MFKTIVRWLFINRRVLVLLLVAVVLAFIVALILGFYLQPDLTHFKKDIWRSFYAAWIEDAVFFTLVGIIIAILNLRKPESEIFEQRVSILFSGKREPRAVIDFAAKDMKRLAAYSPTVTREIIVEDYNRDIKGFKTRFKTRAEIKNLLDDIEYEDLVAIGSSLDEFKNPPTPFGQIVSIKWDRDEKIRTTQIISPGQPFSQEIPIKIKAGDCGILELEYFVWCAADQEQDASSKRVVERFNTKIINRCQNISLKIKLDDAPEDHISLAYNGEYNFPVIQNYEPGRKVFKFRFMCPD